MKLKSAGNWLPVGGTQQTVASGQKPDLVVFYDGFNDLAWQMNLDLSAEQEGHQ